MITFESVGDYPNGYALTNDEFLAIHEVVQKDTSASYVVREYGVMTSNYHLEVWAVYQDEEVPPGPRYIIRHDGEVTLKPRVRIIKDEEDGDTVFEVTGSDPMTQTNAITFDQAIELANEWAA
jgi:hypothetical protein